jgi:hypothetical protein
MLVILTPLCLIVVTDGDQCTALSQKSHPILVNLASDSETKKLRREVAELLEVRDLCK